MLLVEIYGMGSLADLPVCHAAIRGGPLYRFRHFIFGKLYLNINI